MIKTKQDMKRIVEGALNTLQLDYSIFDILEVKGQSNGWRITFFEGGPSFGQRIFHISVTGGRGSSEEMLREDIMSQLANRVSSRPLRPPP